MKILKQKRLLLWAGITVILLALAAGAFWYLQKRPTLIELQKEMLTAQTDEEKQEILEKLDYYYLTMPIPEAIQQEVEDSVAALMERFDPAEFTPEKLDRQWANLDSNIYLVENRLSDLLRHAMIARRQEDIITFQTIMNHAQRLADTVDSGTDNNYWRPWVAKVKDFGANMSRDWLLANRAEKLCYKHHLGDFERAEEFGSMAMQFLQQVKDERLRLNITQRLLVILFQYRGMYDLSYALAEKGIERAKDINFLNREIGLTYNLAEAFVMAGENYDALLRYEQVFNETGLTRKVSWINWYKINSWLGIAKANWSLGKYKKALSICEEIEKLAGANSSKMHLYNIRAIANANLGKYDKSREDYIKALNLAVSNNDTINQIIMQSNLGDLYFRLTEYDKANSYYRNVGFLLSNHNPPNYDRIGRNLIRLAKLAVARNEKNEFKKLIEEAEENIGLINIPVLKGRYLVSLGQLNMEIKEFDQSYYYFSDAIAHYDSSGMFKDALETKTRLIQTLISRSKYHEARKKLDDLYPSAVEIRDMPTQIDAIGLSAYIAYKQNNIDEAIQKSNRLMDKVEELSSQISDLDILTTFRQKINPYLKKAVFYELKRGRIDSAFVKLDYLKAREAKHRLTHDRYKSDSYEPAFVNVDSLRRQLTEKQILINYLVSEDTLYAFVLDRNKAHLFERAIHIDELRRLGNEYMELINNCRKYLDPYQPVAFQANYDSVVSFGGRLYEILLGWPELDNLLQFIDITYVIPDDILYGIPFSCLIASDESQPQFLIQQTSIVNLPSAVFLRSSQPETVTRSLGNKRVLICTDRQEFPMSNKLVNHIKRKFPESEELMIDKSNIENEDVLAILNQHYDIYFFIAHSIPNLKFPDLSTIQLTPLRMVDKKPFPVNIPLRDLKRIDWSHAKMVFLIGCETAIGKLYEGSGFAGFQQNLLTRGAEGVMASFWKIDNAIAFQQIGDFLGFWQNTGNPALALQTVEVKWINRLQTDVFYKVSHPYLWKILSLSQTIKYYNGG